MAYAYGGTVTSDGASSGYYTANTICYSNAATTHVWPSVAAEPEDEDDGEESALEWLDRRIDEVCVEL